MSDPKKPKGKDKTGPALLGLASTLSADAPGPAPFDESQLIEQPTPVVDTSSTVRGDSIGRFLLIDILGEGGMGAVLLGYDPMLNRRVAIKVLAATKQESATARLVREAQAMAKIQHPNVVTVFDAGKHEDQVFIAMEYVEGGTFSDWMRSKRKARTDSWQEVLKVMVAAGRGLAAAHERELVHRDFKPDNILISEAGEVKVADFGIVSAGGEHAEEVAGEEDTEGARESTSPELSPLSSSGISKKRLTLAGAIMGTPAYMSPEQLSGDEVDARADQFAFCIVLYEALYGELPFSGETLKELAANANSANFKKLDHEVALPTWLKKALIRGLAPKPADRFPSMKALVDELARDRKSRIMWFALAAALIVMAAGASWLMMGGARKAPIACQDSAEHLVGTWDPGVKKSVKAAFVKTGVGYQDTLWNTVSSHLDEVSANWVSMRKEACEATRVHKTQSVELLDRRMACLERRRQEMAALTTRLAEVDVSSIAHAAEAVTGLEDLDRCSLTVVATAGAGEIIDPSLVEKVQSLQVALSEAQAMGELGKHEEAIAWAEEIFASAKLIEASSLSAEAALVVGRIAWRQGNFEESVDWLISSLAFAEKAGNQLVRLSAVSVLIYVVGWELAQPTEALHWGEIAGVLAEKVGVEGQEKGNLEWARAAPDLRAGHFEAAEARIKTALAIYEKAGNRLATARALTALGAVAIYTGDFKGALDFHDQALKIRIDALGADHPDTSESLNNVGSAYAALGQYQVAREKLLESLRISEAAFGAVHPDIADPLNNLGAVDFAEGQYASAATYFERSIAIVEETQGSDHLDLATTLLSLGSSYLLLDRASEAVVALERALGNLQRHAASAERMADVEFTLARALVEASGDGKRAQQLAERARLTFGQLPEYAEQAAEVSEWLAER